MKNQKEEGISIMESKLITNQDLFLSEVINNVLPELPKHGDCASKSFK